MYSQVFSVSKITVIFLLSGLLISCSGGSKSSSTALVGLKPSGGSCDFRVNDGDTANLNMIGADNELLASFNKPYNDNYLTAVLTTSLEETIRFINETGVTVYKAPSDNSGCNMFTNAANPSAGLLEKWNKESKDDGPKTGYLLGLYLPKKSVDDNSNADKAAILVRENTNRWTVVHEFMHHLFMLKQEDAGLTDYSIRLNMVNDLETYNNLKQSLDSDIKINNLAQSDKQKLEKAYQKFVSSFDILVRSFTLEEMTIEKKLHDLYDSGSLKFVPNYAYDSGIRYIHSSAEKAKEFYKLLQDESATLRSTIYSFDTTKIDSLVSSRLNEVNLILQQYPIRALNDEADSSDLLRYKKSKRSKKYNYKHTCSREKSVEKLFEKIKLTLKKDNGAESINTK